MISIHSSAPAKAILFGEHAVVYGHQALVVAVNRRIQMRATIQNSNSAKQISTKVRELLESQGTRSPNELLHLLSKIPELKVWVGSDIPRGSGLGSSAAFSVALAGLILCLKDLSGFADPSSQPPASQDINDLAYRFEQFFHGTPSGVDNTASVMGGAIRYQRVNGEPVIERLPAKHLPQMIGIMTGRPKESTAEMVRVAREHLQEDPSLEQEILRLGELSSIAIVKLEQQALTTTELLPLFKQAHRGLTALGVVSPSTQSLVSKIEQMGGAAKISGAGGSAGHSGLLLAVHEDLSILKDFLKKKRLKTVEIELSKKGVVLREKA